MMANLKFLKSFEGVYLKFVRVNKKVLRDTNLDMQMSCSVQGNMNLGMGTMVGKIVVVVGGKDSHGQVHTPTMAAAMNGHFVVGMVVVVQ